MQTHSGTAAQAAHDALVEAWLATFDSANTRAAYRTDVAVFGRWCAARGEIPLHVDTTAMAAFQAARELAGDSAATRQRRWSALSSFYDFALAAGSIGSNPVEGAARPRNAPGNPSRTAVLTTDLVDAFLASAARLGPRLEALVALIVFDGLKVGEALTVDVDDVAGRPPNVTVRVRRGGTTRRVALHAASAGAVHRCAGRRRGQPLFVSARRGSDGAPERLTRFGADHLLRQLDSGGRRVTANELRRYHLTTSLATCSDAGQVCDRAGLGDTRSLRRFLIPPDMA